MNKSIIPLILSILLLFVFSAPLVAYNGTQIQRFGVYMGFALPGIPRSLIAGPPMISTKLDINLPITRFLPKNLRTKNLSAYLAAKYYSSFFRFRPYPSVEEYIFHIKYESHESKKFAVVPFLGTRVILNHSGNDICVPLDFGAILGYTPFRWLEIYTPASLSLFADGFMLDFNFGAKFCSKFLHLRFNPSFGWALLSNYDFGEIANDFSINTEIGVEF